MILSIVIPFYNEEESIKMTHQTISQELAEIPDCQLEFIFVNDGSRDQTLKLMKEIANQDSRVKYISFSRNFGKEAGIIAGFKHATGDLVVLMDGDLQHPPRVVIEMVKAYRQGYDVISAQRTRTGESMRQTFFAKWFYRIANNVMDIRLKDGVSDFRAFSRKAMDAILSLNEYNRFSKGIFSWIGFKEKTIPYENQLRQAGETKFSFSKSLNYAIQGMISFNNKPLRITINIGVLCIIASFLYLLWLLIEYFLFPETVVSGYFSTIFIIVFFGGVQLISIGILGEYIGKIYYEVKRRPHYIIDETNIEQVVK